jgi:hypothetical protein
LSFPAGSLPRRTSVTRTLSIHGPDVLKRMKLTNDDQEAVAKAIAGDKVDPEKAGKDWVEQNQDKVQAWLGEA